MTRYYLRSFVLTTALFSILAWLYVVLRIVINGVDMSTPFIDAFPILNIWQTGAVAFVLAFLSVLVYLSLWGNFDHTCARK